VNPGQWEYDYVMKEEQDMQEIHDRITEVLQGCDTGNPTEIFRKEILKTFSIVDRGKSDHTDQSCFKAALWPNKSGDICVP
jgi:hypothetical protein